jgi:subtilase family serine protease
VKPLNDTFIQAAIEGIGIYFSSGDDGDQVANLGLRSVDWPAASPWVTAVGGTTLAVTAGNNYLFETGWGTTRSILSGNHWSPNPPGVFLYASGGGTSRIFPQPFYQVGVVPAAIAGFFGANGRAVPDVAMDGDPNSGMLEGQTQTFPDGTVKYSEYRIGGTSLSSPLFAG